MYRILTIGLLLSLLVSCRNDTGVRLFTMNFITEFSFNGVLNTIESHYFPVGPLNSNISRLMNENDVSDEDITRIEPNFAVLKSLDGYDLDFIEEISVRICPVSGGTCQLEVFYLDDIPFRTRDEIDLLPSLSNVKSFFINQNQFRLELVFLRLRNFSPANMQLRFDFGFDARK